MWRGESNDSGVGRPKRVRRAYGAPPANPKRRHPTHGVGSQAKRDYDPITGQKRKRR